MTDMSTFVLVSVNGVCKCVFIPMVAVLFSSTIHCFLFLRLPHNLWFCRILSLFPPQFLLLAVCIAIVLCQQLLYLSLDIKYFICAFAIQFVTPIFTNIEYPRSSPYIFRSSQVEWDRHCIWKNRREAPLMRLCRSQCGVNRLNALSVFM